jgi:heme exporter protein B
LRWNGQPQAAFGSRQPCTGANGDLNQCYGLVVFVKLSDNTMVFTFFIILLTFFSMSYMGPSSIWLAFFFTIVLSISDLYKYDLIERNCYLLSMLKLETILFIKTFVFWLKYIGPILLGLPFYFIIFDISYHIWQQFFVFFVLISIILTWLSAILTSFLYGKLLSNSLLFIILLPFYLPLFLYILSVSDKILNQHDFISDAIFLGGFCIFFCILSPFLQSFFYRYK